MEKLVIIPEIGEEYEFEGIKLICAEGGKSCKDCHLCGKSDAICRMVMCGADERGDRKNIILTFACPLGEIVKECAEKLFISLDDLSGKKRDADIVNKRHAVWYILRKKGFKIVEIADYFKIGSHSSIIHAVNKITNFIDLNDSKITRIVDQL